MRLSIGFVFIMLWAAAGLHAESAGPLIVTGKFPTWKEVQSLEADGRKPEFSTVKYVPRDGRNAAFLITFLGKGRIADLAELKSMHEIGCRPFLSGPSQHFETKEIKLPHGRGVYSLFEDPDLVGKPPIRDNYKFTAPIDIFFENGAIAHATIFTDERAGPTFDEAMAICLSCDLTPETRAITNAPNVSSAGPAELEIISAPGLDACLGIPKKGLVRDSMPKKTGSSYFSFWNGDGIVVSGWLDSSTRFPGFRNLWETDKAKMERGMDLKIQEEKLDMVGGWQAVSYVIRNNDGFEQVNLRASRTVGNTWFDVHLSTTGQIKPLESLKAFLKNMPILPKTGAGVI